MFLFSWPRGATGKRLGHDGRRWCSAPISPLSGSPSSSGPTATSAQRSRGPNPAVRGRAARTASILPAGHWIYSSYARASTLTELYERSLEEEALLQDLEDRRRARRAAPRPRRVPHLSRHAARSSRACRSCGKAAELRLGGVPVSAASKSRPASTWARARCGLPNAQGSLLPRCAAGTCPGGHPTRRCPNRTIAHHAHFS